MNLPKFVGDQTPKVFDENTAVHFLHRIPGKNEKGWGTITTSISRVPLKVAKRYKNIEDILSDVKLLPLSTKVYTVMELKCQIAGDAHVQFPDYFEEFAILAHAGIPVIDRPIAYINHPEEGKFYVAHPEIEKFIKRVNADSLNA